MLQSSDSFLGEVYGRDSRLKRHRAPDGGRSEGSRHSRSGEKALQRGAGRLSESGGKSPEVV